MYVSMERVDFEYGYLLKESIFTYKDEMKACWLTSALDAHRINNQGRGGSSDFCQRRLRLSG
jgi:hypothetical protein